jgi:hypothetical protein
MNVGCIGLPSSCAHTKLPALPRRLLRESESTLSGHHWRRWPQGLEHVDRSVGAGSLHTALQLFRIGSLKPHSAARGAKRGHDRSSIDCPLDRRDAHTKFAGQFGQSQDSRFRHRLSCSQQNAAHVCAAARACTHKSRACIGGQGIEPQEQNTQQSPCFGRSLVPQPVHT